MVMLDREFEQQDSNIIALSSCQLVFPLPCHLQVPCVRCSPMLAPQLERQQFMVIMILSGGATHRHANWTTFVHLPSSFLVSLMMRIGMWHPLPYSFWVGTEMSSKCLKQNWVQFITS